MSIRASDGMEASEARLGEEINLTPVLRYPDDVRYSKRNNHIRSSFLRESKEAGFVWSAPAYSKVAKLPS